MPVEPEVSLPVAVIMGRRMIAGHGWGVPSWRVVALVAGSGLPGREAQGTPVPATTMTSASRAPQRPATPGCRRTWRLSVLD